VPGTTSRSERLIAAGAHLGVPIYSVVLPGIVWATSSARPFARAHARQAFSFQCLFLIIWFGLVVGMAANLIDLKVMLVALVAGIAAEVPQVLRALGGRQPLRLLPPVLSE
jgi:hypothetical protein